MVDGNFAPPVDFSKAKEGRRPCVSSTEGLRGVAVGTSNGRRSAVAARPTGCGTAGEGVKTGCSTAENVEGRVGQRRFEFGSIGVSCCGGGSFPAIYRLFREVRLHLFG